MVSTFGAKRAGVEADPDPEDEVEAEGSISSAKKGVEKERWRVQAREEAWQPRAHRIKFWSRSLPSLPTASAIKIYRASWRDS